MSHEPSLLFPSLLNTTSRSTCTPIRPSARPSARLSTRPSLMPTSHGDLPYADPSNVSFCPLVESHFRTGYEPKNLTEEDNSILVKSTFFHGRSMTSTCESAESIATPPPESDLDDEQMRNMLHYCLYKEEKQELTNCETRKR